MDRNFQRALSLVLKHEGGFVNHPKDPGGATNRGVTIATFRRYVKPNGTVEDLKRITDQQVATVYRRHYWDAVAGAELPDGVDYAVFDFAVNSGPSRAAKYLQSIVGVTQDGRIGPVTLKAVRGRPHADVIHKLCDARMAFLRRLSTWATFGKGWTNRVTDVRRAALDIAARPVEAIPAPPAIVIEKPVVADPGEMETPPSKSKTVWTWALTAVGAPIAAFGNLDWRVQLAIVAVIVGFAIYGIKRRADLFNAVKDLKAELG